MEYFAGLDVSMKETSICVVDAAGEIVAETVVASEPAAIGAALAWATPAPASPLCLAWRGRPGKSPASG